MSKKRRNSWGPMGLACWLVVVVLVSIVACGASPILAGESEFFFHRTERFDEAVIARFGEYDYQASVIEGLDGSLAVWYCGGINNHDSNFHVTLDADGNQTSSILEVVYPSGQDGHPDGLNTCDQSVVLHSFPGVKYNGGVVQAGEELYYMYYECGPYGRRRDQGYIRGGFSSEICLAASLDGVSWMKYSSQLAPTGHFGDMDTAPTPVVARDSLIEQNCELSTVEPGFEGEYVITWDNGSSDACKNRGANYGSGHPSALTMEVSGSSSRQIWLFYYDSKGDWGEHGMYLRKSWDGFHFGGETQLVLVDPETGVILTDASGNPRQLEGGRIVFVDQEVAGHDGIFIATNVAFSKTYFAYSFDGVHWVAAWPPFVEVPPGSGNFQGDQHLRLAGVRADEQDPDSDLCVIPGAPTLSTDRFGHTQSLTNATVLVGEGYRGHADPPVEGCESPDLNGNGVPDEDDERGSTWDLFMMRGDFGQLVRPSSGVCDLYDGENLKVKPRRTDDPIQNEDEVVFLDSGTYYTYSSEADFLALNDDDPFAYRAVHSSVVARVVNECPYGGDRPVCDLYDSENVRNSIQGPGFGTIYWIENGQRFSYSGWNNGPNSFVALNYGLNSNWTNILDATEWSGIVNTCGAGGLRPRTVCHDYDAQNIRSPGFQIVYLRYGNRYGYSGWDGDSNSFKAFYPNPPYPWINVPWATWDLSTASCPYAGLRGVLNP